MTDLSDEADETPLDPATERLRRRLVRLLALSVSTLLVGVMAVLGAIVYKLNRDAAPAGEAAADIAIALPAGSAVLDMALDGGTALFRLGAAGDGSQSLLRVDLGTGAILSRHALQGPAPTKAPPDGTHPPLLELYRSR